MGWNWIHFTSMWLFVDGKGLPASRRPISKPGKHFVSVRRKLAMSNNDEVGFGKPPKRTQFQKGVSGNPKGRPKGSRNLATVLSRTLRENVVVNDNGRRRTMSKLDAAVAQLVNKSASGDLVALRQLIALAGSVEN